MRGADRDHVGAAMKETTKGEGPNRGRDDPSPESENPSDCCDFGFVLLDTGRQLSWNGISEAHPRPQPGRDRQFDPAEQWGKA